MYPGYMQHVRKRTVGGRPSKGKKRTKILTLAFTDEELSLLTKAADRSYDTRANWCRRRLLIAARIDLGLDPDQPRRQ